MAINHRENVFVLIANPAHPILMPPPSADQRLQAGAAVSRRLAGTRTPRLPFDAKAGPTTGIDVRFPPAPAQELLVADMESTIIENEMLDELAGLACASGSPHHRAP
jgi:phosphoserine phosphatase